MKDRTTAELIRELGNDIDRCHRELVQSIDAGKKDRNGDVIADYEYHARQLIRAIFAFIEALTFSAKVKAVEYGVQKKQAIPDAERLFAIDFERVLSDKGEVVDRPAHLRLADNIRFAFNLQEKVLRVEKRFDPSVEWWSCLKSSIKVRDRLTHPKLPGDIDISGDEIVAALKAYEGFKEQLMLYANLRDGKKQKKRKVHSGGTSRPGTKVKRSRLPRGANER